MNRYLTFGLVLLLCGCGSKSLPAGSYDQPFNDSIWRSASGLEMNAAHITPRQKMLGDLVEKHLVGKTKQEIIAILGEPSTKMDLDGTVPSLSYPTGPERSSYMRVDSEWLLIYFDSSGTATRYSIGVD